MLGVLGLYLIRDENLCADDHPSKCQKPIYDLLPHNFYRPHRTYSHPEPSQWELLIERPLEVQIEGSFLHFNDIFLEASTPWWKIDSIHGFHRIHKNHQTSFQPNHQLKYGERLYFLRCILDRNVERKYIKNAEKSSKLIETLKCIMVGCSSKMKEPDLWDWANRQMTVKLFPKDWCF